MPWCVRASCPLSYPSICVRACPSPYFRCGPLPALAWRASLWDGECLRWVMRFVLHRTSNPFWVTERLCFCNMGWYHTHPCVGFVLPHPSFQTFTSSRFNTTTTVIEDQFEIESTRCCFYCSWYMLPSFPSLCVLVWSLSPPITAHIIDFFDHVSSYAFEYAHATLRNGLTFLLASPWTAIFIIIIIITISLYETVPVRRRIFELSTTT